MQNSSLNKGKTQALIDPNETKAIEECESFYKANKKRWLILALSSLTGVGDQLCQYLPQTLQNPIMQDLGISLFEFNLFSSVLYFSNIFIPFLSGFLINKLGVRRSYVICATLVFFGLCISTLGAYKESYAIMLVGQAIYALGAESLIAAQCTMIAKWFLGQELSFALGLVLTIGRIGMSVNSAVFPYVLGINGKLWTPYLVGSIVCLISLIVTLFLVHVDGKQSAEGEEINQMNVSFRGIWKDLKTSSKIVYLLLLNCLFLSPGFFGFINDAMDMMEKRFGYDIESGGMILPIIYFCTVIMAPPFGFFADKKGQRVYLIIGASVLLLASHIMMAALPDAIPGHPDYLILVPFFGLGMFYAVYTAAFWPCLSLVIEEKMISIAYGLTLSFQSFALAIIPLIIATINQATSTFHHGYFWTEIMLVVITAFGVLVSIILHFEDKKTNSKLNKSVKTRESIGSRKSRTISHNFSM